MFSASTEYIRSKLMESNTTYKRRKLNKLDDFYVAPLAKAIGSRFEMKKINEMEPALPIRLQCTFAYVPIIETVKCLFRNEDFLKKYLEYNENGNGHTCKKNEYADFCCGSIYEKSELFRKYPNALQFQIFCDDFEVCNVIGSKATIHKMCGVYFVIRNMPNNSKLNNIYLVALCNSDDLKTKETDFNSIWRPIKNEIQVLESDGIFVANNLNLKGALVAIVADNLGANTSLGFVESFNSNYYCRICMLSKNLCQTSCKEIPSEMRTRKNYEEALNVIGDSSKVDFSETKGIKRNCILNELQYFHVTQNFNVDIMHDVQEGTIPFMLRLIFNYCIDSGICSEKSLIEKIQYFDYGVLNKKNVPSMVNLDKSNLNQNAAQSKCLFMHTPFILYEYRDELDDVWICMKTLMKVCQIIFSRHNTKKDVEKLKKNICGHLKNLQIFFDVALIPKHHEMTHYPTIILTSGPVLFQNVIRFEAKHQMLKSLSKNNKNFKNLNQTIAEKHQKSIAISMRRYTSEKVSIGKKKSTKGILSKYGIQSESEQEIFETNWVRLDDCMYRKGLLILHENYFYEINKILYRDSIITILCSKYCFGPYNKFLNSFEIQKFIPEIFYSLDFSLIKCGELYEKKKICDREFVMVENLTIQRAYETTMKHAK